MLPETEVETTEGGAGGRKKDIKKEAKASDDIGPDGKNKKRQDRGDFKEILGKIDDLIRNRGKAVESREDEEGEKPELEDRTTGADGQEHEGRKPEMESKKKTTKSRLPHKIKSVRTKARPKSRRTLRGHQSDEDKDPSSKEDGPK